MPTNSEYTGYPDGYAVGQGGVATQQTGRTTTVVLNGLNGQITLFAATLAADTTVSFTFTNSFIKANDMFVFNVVGGAAVLAAYFVAASSITAGSAVLSVHNVTPTISASESPVIAFAILRGSIT